jgi:hypothetical protein
VNKPTPPPGASVEGVVGGGGQRSRISFNLADRPRKKLSLNSTIILVFITLPLYTMY